MYYISPVCPWQSMVASMGHLPLPTCLDVNELTIYHKENKYVAVLSKVS